MKTTIKRDTNYSFIKRIENEKRDVLSVKIEKGSADYGNACLDFHKAGVKIEIGNIVTK